MNKSSVFFQSPLAALLLFFCLWFGMTCFSGSLFSGYHIVDDHEIISIHNDFNNHVPLLSVLKRELTNDFSIRFRPLFYADRILTIRVLGDNFLLWSIYRTIMAVFTSFLLFIAARNLGFGFWEAFLFPLLSLFGIQSNVWFWRGPAEAGATLLFAFSLYCICLRVHDRHAQPFHNIAFIISCVAMSLTKENYTLTIPSLCVLAAYFDKSRNNVSWADAIKTRWVVYAFLFCFVAADLAVINYIVGTNRIGYAGVQINVLKYAAVFCQYIVYNGEGIVLCMCILLFAVFYRNNREKSLVFISALLLFVALQSFLYAKSGLLSGQGRYLLPASIGFGLAISAILHFLKNNPNDLSGTANAFVKSIFAVVAGSAVVFNLLVLISPGFSGTVLSATAFIKGHAAADHWTGTLHQFSIRFFVIAGISLIVCIIFWKETRRYHCALILACIMLCYCLPTAFAAGGYFSKEGKEVEKCMNEISLSVPDSSFIVIVADPGLHAEGVTSVTRYLTLKMKKKNIRYWFFDAKTNDRQYFQEWKDTTLAHFGRQRIESPATLDSAFCLLFLQDMEKPFFASLPISTPVGPSLQRDFTRKKWGDLVCYFHN
jgi:hypothetical protein